MNHQVNDKITLASGRVLEFQVPPLKLAMKLKCLVFRLALATDIGNTKLGDAMKAGNVSIDGLLVNDLKNVFCGLLGSDELDAVLLECMKAGSTLEGQRITESIFEPPEFRRDFLPCQKEVGWRTLSPFFADAGSLLSGLGSLTTTKSPT